MNHLGRFQLIGDFGDRMPLLRQTPVDFRQAVCEKLIVHRRCTSTTETKQRRSTTGTGTRAP
jgi:hypothetical protein